MIKIIKKMFKKNKRYKRHNTKKYNFFTPSLKFKSNRNTFKLFVSKISTSNWIKEIKNLNLYFYLLSIFISALVIYVLLFSHYFSIKEINMYSESSGFNINLWYRSIDDIRYKSIFLTDLQLIDKLLKEDQPAIKSVNIRRNLPDKLNIKVDLYDNIFNTTFKNKDYNITTNWVLIPWNIDPSIYDIEIKWLDPSNYYDYKSVIKKNSIDSISNILKNLYNIKSDIQVLSIIYYINEDNLILKIDSWYYVIFDLREDVLKQLSSLNIFIKEYIGKIEDEIIYIDLRVDWKIYYCLESTKASCFRTLKYLYDIEE